MSGPVEADGVAEGDGKEEAPGRDLLSLRLGEARFGLWVDEVLEILAPPPISRLPLAHEEVAGVTSVRGEVVPVLDLGVRLLGTPARRPGRMVLLRHAESGALLGLLVDDVDALTTVADGDVDEPPKAAEATLPPELIRGVVDSEAGVVTILDRGRVTAPPGADPNEG